MTTILNYSQSTGTWTKDGGAVIAHGWAGNHEGKNNPEMQHVHSVGPLPRGLYKVGPWEEMHPGLGPIVAHLEQVEGETFGRSAFYIHGPAQDPAHYGQESKGCTVVPHAERVGIRALNPDFVRVTA